MFQMNNFYFHFPEHEICVKMCYYKCVNVCPKHSFTSKCNAKIDKRNCWCEVGKPKRSIAITRKCQSTESSLSIALYIFTDFWIRANCIAAILFSLQIFDPLLYPYWNRSVTAAPRNLIVASYLSLSLSIRLSICVRVFVVVAVAVYATARFSSIHFQSLFVSTAFHVSRYVLVCAQFSQKRQKNA